MTYGLKVLASDNGVLELDVEMMKNKVVDIYIEHFHGENETQLSEALIQPIDLMLMSL